MLASTRPAPERCPPSSSATRARGSLMQERENRSWQGGGGRNSARPPSPASLPAGPSFDYVQRPSLTRPGCRHPLQRKASVKSSCVLR